jgi:hypothetical protein
MTAEAEELPRFPVSTPQFQSEDGLKRKGEEEEERYLILKAVETVPSERGNGELAALPWPPGSPASPTPDDSADFEEFIAAQLGGRTGEERADLERYLRALPGATVREWKGKGDLWHLSGPEPDQRPWHKLKAREVRALATRNPARTLPHNVRQSAARDPGLVWNPLARRYRLRASATPAPAPATERHVEGAGASKVPDPASSRPAVTRHVTANHLFSAGKEPDHDS